jgi:hypothetical protein
VPRVPRPGKRARSPAASATPAPGTVASAFVPVLQAFLVALAIAPWAMAAVVFLHAAGRGRAEARCSGGRQAPV